MNKCLVCGKTSEKWICKECASKADIDALCNEVIAYIPRRADNRKANAIWEELATSLEDTERFSKYAYELADELPSPRKEYQKIHSIVEEYPCVAKANREKLLEIYGSMDVEALSEWEKNRVKGLILEIYLSSYQYEKAEEIAAELAELADLPWQAYYVTADFYDKTRRYDVAEQIVRNASVQYKDDERALHELNKVIVSCGKHRLASENGKNEFMPSPREDKEKAVSNYINFMCSLGIDIQKPTKAPTPIPVDSYPEPVLIDKADFDSFVAYDFETTGFSPSVDAIIEIGAIKVVDGKVEEAKEFIFSEFVKPYKKSLTSKVTEITGITKDDLKNARQMWEVIPEFMEFVGDATLVGYNNATFDSKFLARAGRYSNIVISNPNFDVLRYLRCNKEQLGYTGGDMKLNTVAQFCGVDNPQAHRAWADAITTAKVYLRLRELL